MKKIFLPFLNYKFYWLLAAIFLNTNFAFASIFINASEASVAGQNKTIHIAGLFANEEVGLDLIRPNQSIIKFSEKANDRGNVTSNIYGLHLREIGTYQLAVSRHFDPNNKISADFQVSSGVISAYKSKINIKTPSIVADGNTKSLFTIKLVDAYGNPVQSRVKVLSSRNEDVIVTNPQTDKFGIATGSVLSKKPGVAVLTVIADDIVLFKRPEIIFHLNAKNTPENVGGDLGKFLKAMAFDETDSEVQYFTIEELPTESLIDTDQTFVVSPKDIDGNIVNNYLGTVRFSTTDNQAEIPEDYTFTPEDQGVHKFHLGARFGTLGEQELSLIDLNDFKVSGQITTMVTSGKITPGDPNATEPSITLLTPTNGETRKSSRVMITGNAVDVESVKIVDGNYTLVEDLLVEDNGSFVFQTPNLADGIHVFRVSNLAGTIHSEVAKITIDQVAPSTIGVEISPEEVFSPGQDFQLLVSSTEPLSTARCNIENQAEKLLDPSGDKFVTQFQAPIECGKYAIQCAASDLIGNERVESNAAQIQVCADDSGIMDDLDLDSVPDREEINDKDNDGVPDFMESSTLDSNNNGITDEMDPSNDTDNDGISNQEEFNNGQSPFNIERFFEISKNTDSDNDGILDADEIKDTDNDLVADILEPNIIIGDEISAAFDDANNDSDEGGVSNAEEAARGSNPNDPRDDYPESPIVENPIKIPTEINNDIKPTAISNLRAEPGENKITLYWSPASDNGAITQYRIEYGTQHDFVKNGSAGSFNITPDNRTRWYIDNLEESTKYFFRVIAIDNDQNWGAASRTIGSTTLGFFKSPPKAPTSGSKSILPLVLALLIGSLSFFYFRPRQP